MPELLVIYLQSISSFTPSSSSLYCQIMPLAIIILFVWFPRFAVQSENHIAIFQFNLHPPVALEDRRKRLKADQFQPRIWILKVTVEYCKCRVDVRTDRLFVLQNETLILCALEPKGDSDIISQTKACEVRWHRAPLFKLCFTCNLDKNMDS